MVNCLQSTFSGKRVWMSGHTGFKGAWLSEWLLALGAELHGFSLPAPTIPSLFEQLGLCGRLHHEVGDVRDADAVRRSIAAYQPDFVFHLAAQPLVRASYDIPVETFSTNFMGTLHVLDALRDHQQSGKSCVAVIITTDKCYENKEWVGSYREDDPMGGYDPYSASKGAAEIAIHAMRRSYFHGPISRVRVASARAGNVIGGGDWATDRIFPDCIRALRNGSAITVRNATSTRPWQHILEPLSGYLGLAVALSNLSDFPALRYALDQPGPASAAFNFGPGLDSNRTVAELVEELLIHWPGRWENKSDPSAPHEASKLNLATDKAFHLLGWKPRWNFTTSIARTADWYKVTSGSTVAADFQTITRQHIKEYQES